MKRLLLLCALAIPCFMACEKMDEAVSPDVEQQQDPVQSYVMRVAEEGIAMLGDAETRAVRRRIDPNRIKPCITTATRSGESDTLYYVVNFADSAGFALVAADSTSPAPLLAVTEQGNYTPGEVTNTGFDDYISLLNERNGSSYGFIIDTTAIGRYVSEMIEEPAVTVNPMLEVNWGQVNPYNNFILNYGGSYSTRIGCVITALAQIMSYHEHPTTYQGISPITLNWDEIKAHNNSVDICWCADTNHTELNKLFELLWVSSGAHLYGSNVIVNSTNTLLALSSLGYSSSYFNPYAFDTVKAEIDANRVIYMRGEPEGGDEYDGHGWVVDGYYYQYRVLRTYQEIPGTVLLKFVRDDDCSVRMLHINWGNDGSYNGYFNDGEWRYTETGGTINDYRCDVQIITHIQPVNN